MTSTDWTADHITDEQRKLLRELPSIDELLLDPALTSLEATLPRKMLVYALRLTLSNERKRILGDAFKCGTDDAGSSGTTNANLIATAIKTIHDISSKTLRRVVNATGIIIHTNLGRSILSNEAANSVEVISTHYSTLEYDTDTHARGSRHSHLESLICYLTGAEAAIAVNNNAAAVLMVLSAFANGKQAIVSRGELVEIGGSFRIPDIMALSGAEMVEVGTTNKTHLSDYEKAITDETSMILKVHPSNYRMSGFTESVPVKELRAEVDTVNKERATAQDEAPQIILYEDQGSGSFIDLSEFGFISEPTVQKALEEGCDLVSFSGDKLLGGAQAGIIVGRKHLVDKLKKNPLMRALRLDKMTIAALEATLLAYIDPEKAIKEIPTLRMLTEPEEEVRAKAEELASMLKEVVKADDAAVEVANVKGQSGGGALPECEIDSFAVVVSFRKGSAQGCEDYLISVRDIPVIGRIRKEQLIFDVRTLLPGDSDEIVKGMQEYFSRI